MIRLVHGLLTHNDVEQQDLSYVVLVIRSIIYNQEYSGS